MNLIEVVKELVKTLEHENIKPSSYQKYVIKLRSSMNREPHIKHFFFIIETTLILLFTATISNSYIQDYRSSEAWGGTLDYRSSLKQLPAQGPSSCS